MGSPWKELRQGTLHIDSINKFIDDPVSESGDAVNRDFQKWNLLRIPSLDKPLRVAAGKVSEVNRWKGWFADRITRLDQNLESVYADCRFETVLIGWAPAGDVKG